MEKSEGDQAQGYYFGRPIPASEIAASLLTNFQHTAHPPMRAGGKKTSAA